VLRRGRVEMVKMDLFFPASDDCALLGVPPNFLHSEKRGTRFLGQFLFGISFENLFMSPSPLLL
jgi:hypothetical protein